MVSLSRRGGVPLGRVMVEGRDMAGEVDSSVREMCAKIFIAIIILLLVQTGQAEEAEYELLWSYETDGRVYGVSISSDGSYIAAGYRDNKVYLFNRDGDLLWNYKTGDKVVGISISSDGSYIAAGCRDNKVYLFNKDGKLLWKAGNGI